MIFELIVTAIIFLGAGLILYKNLKNKSSGKCDCGSCSTHCVNYKEEHKESPKK